MKARGIISVHEVEVTCCVREVQGREWEMHRRGREEERDTRRRIPAVRWIMKGKDERSCTVRLARDRGRQERVKVEVKGQWVVRGEVKGG